MLDFLREWKKQKGTKKLAMELLQEMKDNLEAYYVMSQLSRLRFFNLQQWKIFENSPLLPLSEKILFYAKILADYNASLEQFKKYEEWYTSDINHKTPENARTLHVKREEASQRCKGLDQVIKPAIVDFEQKLYEMKILRKR